MIACKAKLVALVALLPLLAAAYVEQEWTAKTYPNPQLRSDYQLCRHGKGVSSHICDPNHVLTTIEVDELDRLLRVFTEATARLCPCKTDACSSNGYRVTIALLAAVKRDHSDDSLTKRYVAVAEFAKEYESTLRAGQCGEDFLIVYSAMDMIVYTVSGKTARSVVSDVNLQKILQQSLQFFGPGRDVARGLRQILADLREVVETKKYSRQDVGFSQFAQRRNAAASLPAHALSLSGQLSFTICAVLIAMIHK